MDRLVWGFKVFCTRWKNRFRYALQAPFAYRNWWALPLPKLGKDTVLELRNGLKFNVRAHKGELGTLNENLEDPYRIKQIKRSEGDKVILDIGANVGVFSVLCANEYPDYQVFAVEPVGEHVRSILKHLALNKLYNVTVIQRAIGSKDHAEVNLSVDGVYSRVGGQGKRHEKAETISIASLIKTHGIEHVSLLKIDVEGGEFGALLAAGPVLHLIDQISMEYHCFGEEGQDLEVLAEFLRKHGFDVEFTPVSCTGLLWATRRQENIATAVA